MSKSANARRTIWRDSAFGGYLAVFPRAILPGLYVRDEGELVRNGLSIWPLGNPHSRGFILRLGRLQWYFRWSIRHQRLHSRLERR